MNVDVTDKVCFGNPDDEYLPLEKCVCGAEFGTWHVSISIYPDNANECPECGRKFYFKNSITVYQVVEGESDEMYNSDYIEAMETVFMEIAATLQQERSLHEGFSANLMQAEMSLEEIQHSKTGHLTKANDDTYAKIIEATKFLVDCAIMIRERDSEISKDKK